MTKCSYFFKDDLQSTFASPTKPCTQAEAVTSVSLTNDIKGSARNQVRLTYNDIISPGDLDGQSDLDMDEDDDDKEEAGENKAEPKANGIAKADIEVDQADEEDSDDSSDSSFDVEPRLRYTTIANLLPEKVS